MYDLRFVLSPYVCMQAKPNPSPYVFFLYRGPKHVGSQVCTQSLRMYVEYTESFSVHFFCTVEFLCMQVEQNIQSVNILITYSDNRNDDKTLTFMDGGPSNRGRGPDLRLVWWDCGPTRNRIGVVARQGRVLNMQDFCFELSPYV